MARCRNLKPGFFSNEKLAEMPPLTRLLFAGLWCIADRDGRLEDRPKRIKAEILPYDDFDCDQALELLSRGDDPFIVRYQVAQQRYIQVCRFREHQCPHNTEKASVIPDFSLSNESVTKNALPGIGIEVRGIEARGSEVRGTEVKKGIVKGKQKTTNIVEASSVPVPDGFELASVRKAISDWLEYKAARNQAYKDASYLGRKVAEFTSLGPAAFVQAVDSSIGNNYAGIFLSGGGGQGKQTGDPRGNKSAVAAFLAKEKTNGKS